MRDDLLELLKAYRYWVGSGMFLLALFLAGSVFGFWELPSFSLARPHKVFLVALLLAGSVGALPASRIVAWLYDPPKRYLVKPGLTADDAGIYELSPKAFEEMEVVGEGDLFEWPNTKHPTYGVQQYDPEMNIAMGTWRGSASDGEMLDREEEIQEIRYELEAKAKERDVLVTRAERILREEILANTRRLIQEYNRASLVDVGELNDRLEESMKDHDLGGDLDRYRRSRTDPGTAPADPQHETDQPINESQNGSGESKTDGDESEFVWGGPPE